MIHTDYNIIFFLFFFKKIVSAENGPFTSNLFDLRAKIAGLIIVKSSFLLILSQCGLRPVTAIFGLTFKKIFIEIIY